MEKLIFDDKGLFLWGPVLRFTNLNWHEECKANFFLFVFSHQSKNYFIQLTVLFTYIKNYSQPGPGAAKEKFNEVKSTNWTFYVTQSFLSRDPFGFWSLGSPGVQGYAWRGHAYLY